MEYQIWITDITYKTEYDNRVILEVYGKTSDGRSICARTDKFHPYCYLLDPTDSDMAYLKTMPVVRRTEQTELWYEGGTHPAVQIFTKIPSHVKRVRQYFEDQGKTVVASDILFGMRFLYDMDIGPCATIIGHIVDQPTKWQPHSPPTTEDGTGRKLDINETQVEQVWMKEIKECDPSTVKPDFKVLSLDIEQSRDGRILCISLAWADKTLTIENFAGLEGSEPGNPGDRRVIGVVSSIIRDIDPDIITGYNINGYDLPTIMERCELYGIRFEIGRDGSIPRKRIKRLKGTKGKEKIETWMVNGRVVVDAWEECHRNLQLKGREDLGSVAKHLGLEGKLDLDTATIDEAWEDDRDKVLKYCERDAELCLEILDKLGTVSESMALGTVSGLPLLHSTNPRNSWILDSLLIRACDREGVAVPNNKWGEGDEDKIKGATVLDMQAGRQEWVIVLDFKSMYPSIIINNNLCPTTFRETPSNDTHKTPTGAYFVSADKLKGLIPKVLIGLLSFRAEVKERIPKGLTQQEEEETYEYRLQNQCKVAANAFYGLLCSKFYRFTNKAIGGSVTAYGRRMIKELLEQVKADGYEVVGGDTDSLFLKAPYHSVDDSVVFGKKLEKRYSIGGGTVEFEKVFGVMFSHGVKKRYIGRVVWPFEQEFVRGYEMRRGDTFEYQRDTLSGLLNRILDGHPDEACDYARERILFLQRGMVDPSTLIITKGVSKPEEYVSPETMASIQAVNKLKAQGYRHVWGMKVSWIVTDAESPQTVEPYIEGVEIVPDWEYYAGRVADTVEDVAKVYGWDRKALFGSGKQTDLREFNGR